MCDERQLLLVFEKRAYLWHSFFTSLDLMKPSELKIFPSFPMQGVPIVIIWKEVSGMKLITVSISAVLMLYRSRNETNTASLTSPAVSPPLKKSDDEVVLYRHHPRYYIFLCIYSMHFF